MGLILFGYVLELALEWGPLSGNSGSGTGISNSAVGPWLALVCGLVIAIGAALTLDLRASALDGVAVGLRQAAGNVSAAAQSRASAAGAGANRPSPAAPAPTPVATPSAAASSPADTRERRRIEPGSHAEPGGHPEPGGHSERAGSGRNRADFHRCGARAEPGAGRDR